MAKDKTRATNAEGLPIKENKAPAAGDPGSHAVYADKLTFEGDPAFNEVITDPDTGDLLEGNLTPEMQEQLEAKYKEIAQAGAKLAQVNGATLKKMQDAANKAIEPIIKASAATNRLMDTINKSMEPYKRMTAAVKDITNTLLSDATRELIKDLQETMQPLQDLLNEIEALEPYLKAELDKPEYEGKTFDSIMHSLTPAEMLELLQDKDSYLYKAFEAARAARNVVLSQQAGRNERLALKASAKESGAIMEIKGGNLTFFSNQNLWDSFAPGRICRMGTLDRSYIDDETGQLRKGRFEPGELEDLDPGDISVKAFSLLSAITKNTVDNIYEEFVKGGNITFYVKGVLEKFTDDPRTLYDNQLNLDRKTAGVLYLEKLLEPLQGYIGTASNGSRWSVFNYIGYDALTDTMTIQAPYLYQLWKSTQAAYFERQKSLEAARSNNKRPTKSDLKPLEINDLFKGKAYTANEITLEIAVYITNVLLTAGNTGRQKKTEIAYKTIIDNCPRFKEKLSEIEARPNVETLPDGTVKNNASTYNAELKKIKSAFDMILDADRCDATNIYDFISITPSKIKKNGSIEIIAPTKSKLKDKIVICWQRKKD